MRNEEERTIDDEEYTFYQLGALKSHSLLLKIAKIIGPVFGEMVNSTEGDGKKEGLDALLDANIDLSTIIDGLFERADESTVNKIMLTLLSQVTHNGDDGVGALKKDAIIDNHFMGRLPHMYKVVLAAAEVQYGDFFAEGGILDNLKAKVPDGNQKK